MNMKQSKEYRVEEIKSYHQWLKKKNYILPSYPGFRNKHRLLAELGNVESSNNKGMIEKRVGSDKRTQQPK
jgi:antibiotic biosynthesis monooxygenase (ABM) superfamily enzyme